MSTKRVAIIGAGESGLSSCKAALDEGLIPTLFEKNDEIGGVWYQAVWSGLCTNLSRYTTSFSDFPWPHDSPLFPSGEQVLEYLKNYATHFNLWPCIQLNCLVESIKQLENGEWIVRWKHLNDSNEQHKEETFSFVLCTTGVYSCPYMPKFENIDQFKGILTHSFSFKDLLKRDDLKNKKAVVIGASYSGADISAILSERCASVTNIIRRPYWILKKTIPIDPTKPDKCVPVDFFSLRRENFYNKKYKSLEEQNVATNRFFGQVCREQNELPLNTLYIDPNSDETPRFTISDNYLPRIKSGDITVKKSSIKSFTPDGVLLDDGKIEKADIVVMCTGYGIPIEIFERSILDKLEYDESCTVYPFLLYKCTIHPDILNFAYIGLQSCPNFGINELQGKWANKIFSGCVKLPERDVMIEYIDKLRETRKVDKTRNFGRNFISHADGIASELGILPDFDKLKQTNNDIYSLLWYDSIIPSHYKLVENEVEALKIINEAKKIKDSLLADTQ